MKNILKTIVVALILFAATKTNAQGSDVVNVNVVINQLMSLEVFGDQVTIGIATEDEFANGKTVTMNSHVRVTANVSYEIQSYANDNFTDGTNSIGIENLSVSFSPLTGASTFTPSAAVPMVSTSASPITLGSSNGGDIQRYFNVAYDLEGGDHLLVEAGTYNSIITYTILPL